jgi:23S rRNA pseudouridine1911/1915/1917 synthase
MRTDTIVIDKPAHLVVHPAAGHASGTLVNALIHHCGASLSGIGGGTPRDSAPPGQRHFRAARRREDGCGAQGSQRSVAAHGADGRMERAYLALVWENPCARAASSMRGYLAVP